jgi:CheY-like chemotaxis protein
MAKPVMLTVDDDRAVLAAVAGDLRPRYGRDYRIETASSGQEALGLLRELKKRNRPVALLLADQRMPEMDGVTFLQEPLTWQLIIGAILIVLSLVVANWEPKGQTLSQQQATSAD